MSQYPVVESAELQPYLHEKTPDLVVGISRTTFEALAHHLRTWAMFQGDYAIHDQTHRIVLPLGKNGTLRLEGPTSDV